MNIQRFLCKVISTYYERWIYGYPMFGEPICDTFPSFGIQPDFDYDQGCIDLNTLDMIDTDTLCMCTGVTDSTDTMIFENDIVEWYEDYDDLWGDSRTGRCEAIVTWDSDTARYVLASPEDTETYPLDPSEYYGFRVVGNVYDNRVKIEKEEL